MNTRDHDRKDILDRATEELRGSEPPETEIEASAGRVWRRLAAPAEVAADPGVVRDCAGFVAMIDAYRQGTLPAARRELFEDHTRTCVECRRALWASHAARRSATRPAASAWSGRRRWALAAAAVLVAAVGVKLGVLDRVLAPAANATAVAERVDGSLFRVADGRLVPVAAAETVAASEVVRTGRGTRAVLRLADGSRVEMNEHSELAVEPRRDGAAVALHRGDVIVEAAAQAAGRHLYVDAPDCEVSVKGTVFTVSHGPKGSRVSVLEGEVWVEQGNEVTKLAPGQQASTQVNIAPVPVAEEVAWSSDPQRYAALLHELSEVSKQVMAKLADVPLRYESPLVPLLRADTFIFASVPNVTRELADAGTDLEQRIQANPQLKAWFDQQRAANPNAPDFVEVLARFRELGSFCGDEFVVGVAGTTEGGHPNVVLLTETANEAGLVAAIRDNLQRMSSQAGTEIPVVVVDDPAAIPVQPGHALYILVAGGRAVATDSTEEIVRLAGGAPSTFTSTPFHAQIARCYRDGVTWLFAADVEHLTRHDAAGAPGCSDGQIAEELGLRDVQYVIFEHKRIAEQSQLRGVVAFSRERRGVPAWLGAPAPMGALEFVSPNAYAVACGLSKEPGRIADEFLAALRTHDPEGFGKLTQFESEHGFSLRDDLAAPLGGEFLVAVDGPVLPTPAWKLVVLVEDPARLQQAIAKLVTEANVHLAAEGKPTLAITTSEEGGATFTTLASSDGVARLHWTYWDGYMVAAADRVLITEALRTKQSGLSLPTTTEFRASLPVDGAQQYSALGFVNAAKLGSAIASAIPGTADANAQLGLGELRKLLAETSTMALCVTGEDDRILITSTGIDLLNPGRILEGLAKLQLSAPHGPAATGSEPSPKGAEI